MIGRVYAIALTTFREAIRNRVLYGVTFVVISLNLFALVLGAMSQNAEARVARDVGLAGISLFGSITAILLGVTLLYSEIQRRTIHPILAKPIHRYEFVLGKYVGISLTLSVLVALFAVALLGTLAIQDVPADSGLFKAMLLAFTEVLVVAAVAVFFSSFSTPFLSGIFSFAIFFVGRVTPEMRAIAEQSESGLFRTTCEIALKVVPDLHLFAVSGGTVGGEYVSVHSTFVTWGYVGSAMAYGALYCAALLVMAMWVFSRRDFA